MKTGWLIFLDSLLNFIVYSNFLPSTTSFTLLPSLLRGQVTALLNNGKIVTTEAKAKEVRKIAEGIIALAVKEKDNYGEVTEKQKLPAKIKTVRE